MSLKISTIKGMIWTFLKFGGERLSSLVVLMILARLLAPEQFGVFGMAIAIVEIFIVIARCGLADTIIQAPDLSERHLDTSFWASLLIGLLCLVFLSLSSNGLGQLLRMPEMVPVLNTLGWLIPIMTLGLIPDGLLRKNLRFRELALVSLVSNVLGGVVGVLAALSGGGLWSIVAMRVVSAASNSGLCWAVSGWKPRLHFRTAEFRTVYGFGTRLIALELFGSLNWRILDLLIGTFLGATALGYFRIAWQGLTLGLQLTLNIIQSTAFPVFSQLQSDKARLAHFFQKMLRFTAGLSFPCFFLASALAPELVGLIFGPAWGASAPVFQVLCWIVVPATFNYLTIPLLVSIGKPGTAALFAGFQVATVAVLALIAVQFDIRAVAAAHVIRGFLFLPVTIWLWRWIAEDPLKGVAGPVGASFLSSVLIFGLVLMMRAQMLSGISDIGVILIASSIGLSSYLLMMLLLTRSFVQEAFGELRQLRLSASENKGRIDPA